MPGPDPAITEKTANYDHPLSTDWSLKRKMMSMQTGDFRLLDRYFDFKSARWLEDPRDTAGLIFEGLVKFLEGIRHTIPEKQFNEIVALPYAQAVLRFCHTCTLDDVIFKKADKSLTAVIRNSRIELVCRAEGWTDSDASTAAAKTALMLLGVRRDSWKKCLDAASVLEKLTNGQQVFGNSVGNNWHVPVTVVALPTYDAH